MSRPWTVSDWCSSALRRTAHELAIGRQRLDLSAFRRLVVVGGGKAGAGMAAGVEAALGDELLQTKQVTGWLNVPADCVRPLHRIHLHAARPAGRNEPTPAGQLGAERILDLVRQTTEDDLCLCLLSGGGSALLPAPATGVLLEDKLAATRHLSSAGADIHELNTVRKALSRIKGGGLARVCRAALWSLVLSDVIGDPLGIIASGPTVSERPDPRQAAEVLLRFGLQSQPFGRRLLDYLEHACPPPLPLRPAHHVLIGNNATAVEAAAVRVRQLGYQVVTNAAQDREGEAEAVGRALAQKLWEMHRSGRCCLIWGGEPTVKLVPPPERGLGGRNQQLLLAAVDHWRTLPADAAESDRHAGRWALLSGGTDGEDGPTDAAGAWFDNELLRQAETQGWSAPAYLRRNDAYHFFEIFGGLLKTGPTHTNVCDVRVALWG